VEPVKWHKTIHCPFCGTFGTVRLNGSRFNKRGAPVTLFYCVHCDRRFSSSRMITLANYDEVFEARRYGNKRTMDQAIAWLEKTGRRAPKPEARIRSVCVARCGVNA
jgi:transposase-like protein